MKDLKPAFRFLGIFVALYLGLNVAYGLWISSFGVRADPATEVVTRHSSALLNLLGEDTSFKPKPLSPSISVLNKGSIVMNIFEGCNGINVMIVFISFLLAFGGERKSMMWFIPLGIVLIYLANLVRVIVLYYVAENWMDYFYYAHKYGLTAFLYLTVFVLWWWWIEKVSGISLKKVMSNKVSP